MRMLSPMDAIGPAWARAWEMVFEPFKLKRALKLGLVALVAAMGGSPGFHMNFGNGGHMHGCPMGAGAAAAIAAVAIMAGLVFTVIGLVLFYFGSRMQFVLFEMAATTETTVGPKWEKYGRKTWPWIGLKLLYLLVTVALLVVAAVPFIVQIVRMIHAGAAMDNLQPMQTFHLVMSLFGSLMPAMIVGLAMCAGYVLMQDFVLPVLALEEIGIFDAAGKAWGALCGRFWMTVGYLVMRVVLCIGLSILGALAMLAAILVAAIPLGPIGVGLYYGLHNAGAGGIFLMVLGYILEGTIGLAWLVMCGLVLCAFAHIFYRSYSLYYFGGLYEPLGNLLEPPAAPVASVEAEPPQMA